MTTEAQTPAGVSDASSFSLIQRLADNKYWLGRRYAEWCTAAPTLESAVAAAAMSQDEIGHARSHYPLFRQFTGRDVEPEDREQFHSLSALDHPFGGWVDFVATNFLLDTALTTVYESAMESSYIDLRNRARRIAGEEHVHWLHAIGWVKRLASEAPGTKSSLEAALSRMWPETVMWFGRDDDAQMKDLVDRGIVADLPDEMRRRFVERTSSVTERAGLGIDTSSNPLEWDQWNDTRYRLN